MPRRSTRRRRAAKAKSPSPEDEGLPQNNEAIDEFIEKKHRVALGAGSDDSGSSSDARQPVMDLDVGISSSSSSSEERAPADYGEDDDPFAVDRDIEIREMEEALEYHQAKLRSRVRVDSDEDESDGEDDGVVDTWGRNKHTFYDADSKALETTRRDKTRDDEITIAQDEETAARAQQRKATARLDLGDFADDSDDLEEGAGGAESDSGDSTLASRLSKGDEGKNKNKTQKKKQKQKKKKKKQKKQKKKDQSGSDSGEAEQHIQRDLTGLSMEEKIELVEHESPELLALLKDLEDKLQVVQKQLEPLLSKAKSGDLATEHGISYLELKYHLLLSYCTNIVFYMLLKAEGVSVQQHPVIDELLRVRAIMEKMAPLDRKLQYQVDKLLRLATAETHSSRSKGKSRAEATQDMDEVDMDMDATMFRARPNLMRRKKAKAGKAKAKTATGKKARAPQSSSTETSAEDDEMSYASEESEDAVRNKAYRPPRITAVSLEDTSATRRLEKKNRRLKKRLQKSALLKSLREEFTDAPREVLNPGVMDIEMHDDAAQERRKYEEDNMVRLAMTRKERKRRAAKQRELTMSRVDDFTTMEDFGDLEALDYHETDRRTHEDRQTAKKRSLADYMRQIDGAARKSKRSTTSVDVDIAHRPSLKARQDELEARKARAADRRAERRAEKRRGRKRAREDTEQEPAAPVDPMYLEQAQKVRERKRAKKLRASRNRAALAQVGRVTLEGDGDDGEEGAKRGANWKILKNKGLTPKRKKIDRNPRKKARMKFEKAVIRRKGAVPDMRKRELHYAGEETGINASISRSVKF